jgi:AcrR family transcriptional regulator
VGKKTQRPAPPVVPDLLIAPRSGGYARGQETQERILSAALGVLLDRGYSALTLRAIATEAGVPLGSLTHLFKTRDALVRALLDAVVASYMAAFDEIWAQADRSAEDRLVEVVRLVLDDIQTKKTTRLFPALWALANTDPFVADRVDELYIKARQVLIRLIGEINPSLSADQIEVVALWISGSMEGMTMFAGFEKPWSGAMPRLQRIAAHSILALVRGVRPEDIDPA